MSNASQKRTKRAPFLRCYVEHAGEHHRLVGDDADRAALDPEKPMMMFAACAGWSSKKSPSSATFRISSCMS